MDFEESTGSSDKEVVLEESGAEGKTSEDEIFDESKSEDSSSDENEKAQSKGSKAGNQTTNGDSQKSSSSAGASARANNLDAAGGSTSRLFSTSGPDSVDANAAERIKSTTLRRQRKQVERFAIAPPTTSRDKSIVIPEGAGTKLQDIPYVAEQINVSSLHS